MNRKILTIGDLSQLKGDQPEIVFAYPRIILVGRSNVGKSSLINALLGERVAQVSNQPGKTRAIHFYLWTEAKKILVDLPGYGFARASHAERERWASTIEAYFGADAQIERAAILLDSRHGPSASDRDAISFLRTKGLAMSFIFTKTDAVKGQSARALRRKEASEALREIGYDQVQAHWVSARDGEGLTGLADELRRD